MKKYAEFITLLVTFLFIVLFSYTAVNKMVDLPIFARHISHFDIFRPFADAIAWIIPNAELTITILLMVERTRKAGLYSSFGLMLVFTAFIGGAMIWAKELPCSCGGVLEQLSWEGHLIFNAVWIMLAIAAIVLYPSKPDIPTPRPPNNKDKKNTKVFIAIDQE